MSDQTAVDREERQLLRGIEECRAGHADEPRFFCPVRKYVRQQGLHALGLRRVSEAEYQQWETVYEAADAAGLEEANQFKAAYDTLDPLQQKALGNLYIGGFSEDEVAKILGLPVEYDRESMLIVTTEVDQLLSEARRRLAEQGYPDVARGMDLLERYRL